MRLFFRALRSFMKPGGLVKAGHLQQGDQDKENREKHQDYQGLVAST
jgi:hypothetical protein